jgi:hypothetical protein
MVEEVATGSLGPRFVILSDSRDEFFGLKPLQDSEDSASRRTGLCHEGFGPTGSKRNSRLPYSQGERV